MMVMMMIDGEACSQSVPGTVRAILSALNHPPERSSAGVKTQVRKYISGGAKSFLGIPVITHAEQGLRCSSTKIASKVFRAKGK